MGGKGAGAGGIKEGFLVEGRDIVPIRGGRYELLGAKEVNVKSLASQVKKEVFIGTADGVLARNNRNYMKNTFEVNLAAGVDESGNKIHYTPEGMTFEQFNNISNPVTQRNILADAMTKKFMFDKDTGLVSSFETSGEGEDKKYYNPSGQIRELVTKEVKRTKPTEASIKRGITKRTISKRAKNLMDDVLEAGFEKNKSYFKNKEINGRTITDVDFNGDVVNLYTSPKTSDDPEKETFVSFDLNRQEELETFIDELVVSQYGGDASAEDVKDAIKILLDERKSKRESGKDKRSDAKKAKDLIDKYKQ